MLLPFVSISLQMRILKTTLEALRKKERHRVHGTTGRNERQQKRRNKRWTRKADGWNNLWLMDGIFQSMDALLRKRRTSIHGLPSSPFCASFIDRTEAPLGGISATLAANICYDILKTCAKYLKLLRETFIYPKRIRKCDEDRTISQIKSEPQPGTKEEKEKPSKVKQQHHH